MHNSLVQIEYDPGKAAANFEKHGISFDEAASALLDESALVREDPHAQGESRWVLLGMSSNARLLVVVYTLRADDRIRLISARPATRNEAKHYA